jgi:hypothetical protein
MHVNLHKTHMHMHMHMHMHTHTHTHKSPHLAGAVVALATHIMPQRVPRHSLYIVLVALHAELRARVNVSLCVCVSVSVQCLRLCLS